MEKRNEIITIVDKGEYQKLMKYINQEDPEAFITVYTVSDMRYLPKKQKNLSIEGKGCCCSNLWIYEEVIFDEIITGEVEFYAHTVLRIGIADSVWYKVGKSLELGDYRDVFFRIDGDRQ